MKTDEPVFYTTFSEVSHVNHLNVLLKIDKLGEVLLEVTTSEKWLVYTFSFPVHLIKTINLEEVTSTFIANL